MATRTRSHSGDSPSPFVNQNLISHPGKEVCSFNNADIAALRNSGGFPDKEIIRPFDRCIRSDVSSNEWICFLAYPFSLGLRYPFPEFIMEFFPNHRSLFRPFHAHGLEGTHYSQPYQDLSRPGPLY
ncbi:hypothetical protein Hanom_Chr10g00925641 [Helianthus anomalus]